MPLSVAQLLKQVTKAEALADIIATLQSLKFPAASWQSGSVYRTLMETEAEFHSDITQNHVNVAKGGYLDEAEGDWLTLYADSQYDNQRTDPDRTEGLATLTAAATFAGPQTIAVGDLLIRDTVNGFEYRNITGGTLNASSTLTLTWRAELTGADKDVANNTITQMVTSLAGVTVNNPDPGTGTWITKNGADEEPDATLRTRCRNKWATLSYSATDGAYKVWALESDEAITRVAVDSQNPRGPGSLNVYVAGVSGALAAGTVAIAQGYIDGTSDGVGRKPVKADVLVLSATNRSIATTGTVYIASSFNDAAKQAEINAAVLAFFQGLDIGGTKLDDPLANGRVLFAEYYQSVMEVAGVVNFAPTGPTADMVLLPNEVAVADMATPFTFVSV